MILWVILTITEMTTDSWFNYHTCWIPKPQCIVGTRTTNNYIHKAGFIIRLFLKLDLPSAVAKKVGSSSKNTSTEGDPAGPNFRPSDPTRSDAEPNIRRPDPTTSQISDPIRPDPTSHISDPIRRRAKLPTRRGPTELLPT